MAFFNPEKLKPRKIEIDESIASSESPEMRQRLERIENNYAELDAILQDLESRMKTDERLIAIDEANADDFEETFGIRRKRKWRAPKKKKSKARASRSRNGRARSSSSADPRKPR